MRIKVGDTKLNDNVFFVNDKNRFLKKIKAGKFRTFLGPLMDLFLIIMVFSSLYLIGSELYLSNNTILIVIFLGFMYMIYSIIIGVKDMNLYNKIHNVVIVKNNDTFTQIKPLLDNDIEYLKNNIDKIINDRNLLGYDVIEYNNCKLLKETKHYFEYEGKNKNELLKFRIYKIYFNNDKLKVNNYV